MLVVEGKAARSEMDAATKQADELAAELAELAGTRGQLERARAVGGRACPRPGTTGGAGPGRRRRRHELAGCPLVPAPPPTGRGRPWPAPKRLAMAARSELGSAQARRGSAAAELRVRQEALAKSSSLSGDEDCPLCGQALGEAFAQVQAHREAEVEAARQRLTAAEQALAQATAAAEAALASWQRRAQEVAAARQARREWQQAQPAPGGGRRPAGGSHRRPR